MGIGTGWPIAAELYANGTHVAGCDVAESLIRTAEETYPGMELFVGDIWQVPLEKGKYDLVYCIRSSWYMKDFLNVLDKMLSIANNGGVVAFNILNSKNPANKRADLKAKVLYLAVRLYGAMKVLFLNKDYIAPCPNYHYSQDAIENLLSKRDVKWEVFSINQLLDKNAEFMPKSQKLFFVIKK